MDIQKAFRGMLFFGLLLGLAFATPAVASGSTSTIASGMCQLYSVVQQLLAVVVFILIVVAAIIYAAGQVMGAETRARASVWATSMIIGAVIGIVIYIVVPMVLQTMLSTDFASACKS